jgi:hypothetical protein
LTPTALKTPKQVLSDDRSIAGTVTVKPRCVVKAASTICGFRRF